MGPAQRLTLPSCRVPAEASSDETKVVYRGDNGRLDRDTSPLAACRPFWPYQIEPTHLTVKIGALDAERPGRVRDAAAAVLEDGADVIALEARACLAKRRVETGRA